MLLPCPPSSQVAAVGGSLAGYFGVFHRLMAAKLREAAAVPDERQLAALCRGLKEDCCASQHTYVHAQQVLGELGRHPHGARFRRMSQELEEHAAALHGPVVWKMRQWFVEPGACLLLTWAVCCCVLCATACELIYLHVKMCSKQMTHPLAAATAAVPAFVLSN